MKATTLIIALACLLIAATSAGAQGVNDRASEGRAQPGSGGETRMLQHLLQMNDAELTNLRQTVERIEKMSPQEKAQLRERISKFDNMAPGKVAAMRKKFEAIPREQRETMRKRWMEMSPEQRAEWLRISYASRRLFRVPCCQICRSVLVTVPFPGATSFRCARLFYAS